MVSFVPGQINSTKQGGLVSLRRARGDDDEPRLSLGYLLSGDNLR